MESQTTTEELVKILKNDPDKLAMVLQILSQNKELYNKSPPRKGERFENPTALMRRRQLEEHAGLRKSPKKCLENSSGPSSVPFSELLKGVVAFVEVRGKGEDRSAGAKALMKSMGAQVLDTFSSKVTHVVFKEGSFNTYQKAKLLKAHLVSVLWLEAVKNSKRRLSEKKYPALGVDTLAEDMSVVCDDMQRAYGDIVHEECIESIKFELETQGHANTASGNDDIVDSSQGNDSRSFTAPKIGEKQKKFQEKYGTLESSDSSYSDTTYVDGELIRSTLNQSSIDMSLTMFKEDSTRLYSGNESAVVKNTDTVEMSPFCVTPNTQLHYWTPKDEIISLSMKSNINKRSRESSDESGEFGKRKLRERTKNTEQEKSNYMDTPARTPEDLLELDETPLLQRLGGYQKSENKSIEEKAKENETINEDRPLQEEQNVMDLDNMNFLDRICMNRVDSRESESSKQSNKPVKRRQKRKLFNVRDSIDDTLLINLDLIRNTNMPKVNLAPVLLSKNAAKFVEKYHPKASSSARDEEPEKTAEKKLPKTIKPKSNKENKDREVPSLQNTTKNIIGRRKSTKTTVSQRLLEKSNMGCDKFVRVKKRKKSGISCTRLHRGEVAEFENIVERLGDFFVEYNVTSRTTHLVAGECKRTINLLRALTRGLWILKLEWLYDSYKVGKWLPEDRYELVEYSPLIQICRMGRQNVGPTFKMSLFKDLGPIYVSPKTDPKASELRELIKRCHGRITSKRENASICVGERVKERRVICVTPLWVLDSINENIRKPFDIYLLRRQESQSF